MFQLPSDDELLLQKLREESRSVIVLQALYHAVRGDASTVVRTILLTYGSELALTFDKIDTPGLISTKNCTIYLVWNVSFAKYHVSGDHSLAGWSILVNFFLIFSF